ncbi:MAG: hypothetical protein M1814_000770 [Vezdaea aestivalis]|nr:MAG: hypothetical protein M1814_000770 [Vezdaea aestivalis]
MLEGLVATLLNRFLGVYVQNFDPTQLNVGIWSGDVKLRDLELRREALDALKLPIDVVEGHIGLLTLSIPWSNLKGKPVKVFVEDVFLLAAPKEDAKSDEAEEEKRRQAVKIEKLDSAELLKERSGEGMSAEEQQKNQSFTDSLVTKIVDNLQISVKNIHVRYEDAISTPGHPFALGLTLEEFSAVSTDEGWMPSFIQTSVGVTKKLATLGALAVYWDTDSDLLGIGRSSNSIEQSSSLSHDEILDKFRNMIVTSKDAKKTSSHQYILKPVSGQAKLEMDKTGKAEIPKIKANLLFDEIGFVLDGDQYRDALMLIDLFHYFIRHQEYRKYQPKGVTPKEDPRAWLKFAGDAVLSKIHDRNRRWSWAYFQKRRDNRIRYIELFKKKKQGSTLSAEDTAALKKLEWDYSYEDLRFWRSLARNQLRKENAVTQKAQKAQQSQGWVSWIWGSGKQEQSKEDDTVMNDEQRKELYDAIEWDEKAAIAESVDLPKESIKLQIEASLKTGSFALKKDPHGSADNILDLLFDNFKTKVLQRPESFFADVRLGGLRVYDGSTEGSLFPQIVRVKDTPPSILDSETQSAAEMEGKEIADLNDPFFDLQFENNPLDGGADTAVTAKMKSMEVIFNPNFVVEIVRFFKPPERHMESITALMNSASATVEGIRQQTRAGLEFALEEHKTIDAKLDLQAPLIIIPESIVSKESTCLILDAGHISVNSELIDKKTIKEIQAKQKRQYTDEDFAKLEGLMYDKFLLKLASTQVLIGPSIEKTRSQLAAKSTVGNLHIIDRINIDFVVEVSILPKAASLTKFRVTGKLPLLHASVSDSKYKNLMRLIDVSVPKFDQDGPEPLTPPAEEKTVVPSTPQQQPSQPGSKRFSSSFDLSKKEAKNIIEDDDDIASAKNEKFEDAVDVSADESLKIQQRNFEFNFQVDELRGSLYRSDPDEKEPDKLLVELVAKYFAFGFTLRPFDMTAEVLLKALVIEDYIDENPSPEFKRIVSSKESQSGQERDLFKVKFFKVNSLSPEFMSKYQEIATNIDVSVSTINVVVTRKTLLTLLDFILLTFTNPEKSDIRVETKSIKQTDGSDEHLRDPEVKLGAPSEDKLKVKVELQSIVLILNNDGLRLATLSLNTADVSVNLMGKRMRIGARLGNFSLQDDINQGAAETSSLRQLVTSQGHELADFRYETFDSDMGEDYPGYSSSVFLKSGSIKVNFVEEPFRKIIDFAVKFGKMQAIFNAARQAAANQAAQIQENANMMHFDILVKTPIIVFPRMAAGDSPRRDVITAYLGEIYARNSFETMKYGENSLTINKLSTGIRNIRLTSDFSYTKDRSEELELINKVDIQFDINYAEHQSFSKRPDLEIKGSMTDFNLNITQAQMRFLLELSKSIPAAFATESDDEIESQAMEEVPDATSEPAKALNKTYQPAGEAGDLLTTTDLGPEPVTTSKSWTKLDLAFKIESIGLDLLLGQNDEPIGDATAASLSKFSLNNTSAKIRINNDDAVESEFLIHSFTIQDSRARGSNKFRKIMSSNNEEVNQFMASVSISGGKDRNLIAILTIDSPRVIFALDYLFAVQSFVTKAFVSEEPLEIEDAPIGSPVVSDDSDSVLTLQSKAKSKPTEELPSQKEESSGGMSMAFRINVVDAQVILIANPQASNSEAIVLSTKEVLLSQQHALALQVNKVGMFLCRMDRFEASRLRVLDDFTLQVTMDSRSTGKQAALISIRIDIDPLVLRLSLRDILLAVQIMNKAAELSGDGTTQGKEEPEKLKQLEGKSTRNRKSASNRRSSLLAKQTAKSQATGRASSKQIAKSERKGSSSVMKREELTAHVQGLRLILIGDLHELPLLDMSVQKFDASVRDWSGQMSGDTQMETFVNVYNFSKSTWEPLVEPWQLGLYLSREQNPQCLSVELYSRKMLEITLTSATIALASKSAQFLSQDEDDVLSKPRGADSPYHIRNYTGFELSVWAETGDDENSMAAKLEDGEDVPWRFENWTKMRENLNPDGGSGVVGAKLENSGFDSIAKIPVATEGQTIYALRPKKDNMLHRLLVDVKLESDNVKYITFRSPLQVENNTQIPIEIGVFNPEEGTLLKIEKIQPGESRPSPVGAAYVHSLLVRPDQGFGYGWCTDGIFWKDLLRRSTRIVTCKGESGERTPPFYFQLCAVYDKVNPLTGKYPYMTLRLSAPLEVQNLLPYDFKYRIYDKNTKKDWTNFLRKGGLSPVHVVELSHLLLLSIDMQDTVFRQSEFAIINSNDNDEFRREDRIVAKDNEGLTLNLKLHFTDIPNGGGAFRISVYTPYVILNKTGLSINVKSKTLLQQAKAAAGQAMQAHAADESNRKALPYMFSYPSEDRQNRALLKVGDSNWSKPQTFDAMGTTYDVVLQSTARQREIHVGISVDEGEGKYKMTKVVTLAPRYIINNRLSEEILIREPGSSNFMTLGSEDLFPLHFLRQGARKQLCVCFPGLNNQWSAPFNIADLGSVHVKLYKSGQAQQLIRVEIMMEQATIFVHLSIETKSWPFSIRNESDIEFVFYQMNPNIDEEENELDGGWRPIRYKLPARSIMRYAWDYPAAKAKELVLSGNGKERHVKLAEIGNMIPLKVPATPNSAPSSGQTKTIDINVIADGPTLTLVLSNFKSSKSLYRQKTGTSSQASIAASFEAKDMDTDVTFKAQVRFNGIGISLINTQLKELAYITFRNIEVKYSESALYQMINSSIKWIQIDNQLYGGIFPIILYPSVVPKTGKEMEVHPSFHAMITRVKDDSYGVLYIKYATILLQQMTMEIDEDFIFALLDFSKIPGASWVDESEGKLCDDNLDLPEPKQVQQGQDVYFELLNLQPAQLDLSFVRTERVNVEDKTTSRNPFMFFINVLTMALGNINDAPVRLNALMLENARVSIPLLSQHIQNHYSQEFLYQLHKILGSADFLGNPVGLFNNISSGVADIFYEPYQGFIMTDRPQEFGIGIAKGATSFVKKSVFGVTDSMSKFTGSISKGLAAATMDKQFQDRRRMTRARNRPKHALYGVTAGANSFVTSLASGVGGLAQKPLEGAAKEGFGGFFKGVGKGVIGLATKPAIGVFDLASNVTEGIRNTTTVFDAEGLDRVRLTRFIGTDGIVRPYSQREALGQFWLKQLDNGKYFDENYIAHLELPREDVVVMLTYNRIMLIKSKRLSSEWDVPLKDIQTISKERTGLTLTLRGGTNGPFIPVQEESSRQYLYQKIAVAVNAFNAKYKASE